MSFCEKVLLARSLSADEGTLGRLFIGRDFRLWTLELPWRENAHNVSCIPQGRYEVELVKSEKYHEVYHVTDVPDRTGILVHSGNFAGDRGLGLRSHSCGCILVGLAWGKMLGQLAVFQSRLALQALKKEMKGEPFKLDVIGGYHV